MPLIVAVRVKKWGGIPLHKIISAIAMTAFGCVASQAATYVSTRTAESATAELSITTDDTIGVLQAANILDWTIKLTIGANTITLFGPDSGDNSRVLVGGSQLSATAQSLLFNFSGAANSFVLFQSTVGDRSLYCAQTTNCFDQNAGEEIISLGPNFDNFGRDRETGLQVLASVAPSVPEPATWAMMLLGFGAVGHAMRRRPEPRMRIRLA